MKNLLLAFAILASTSLNATTPTVHYDSVLNLQYVYVQPETWIKNQPQVTRLYVMATFDNGANYGYLSWQLRDSVRIDQNTVNYDVVASGKDVYIGGEDYELWDAESKYLFTYIVGKLNLTLK